MNTELYLNVTEIQRFCMHDGPGVRTTVFLRGCPLRCAWCHNPETQGQGTVILFSKRKCIGCGGCEALCPNGVHTVGEVHTIDRSRCSACLACTDVCPTAALTPCGEKRSIAELLSILEKDRAFFGSTGGLTLSGGEVLMQGETAKILLQSCREMGITTAIETSGYGNSSVLCDLVPHTDLFLYDVKDTDDARHKAYTGVSNQLILENLSRINALGAKIRLRCLLINGVNTHNEHYQAIAKLALGISLLDGVEFLSYHAYGGSKSELLGGVDNGRVEWIPTDEQLAQAKAVLLQHGISQTQIF